MNEDLLIQGAAHLWTGRRDAMRHAGGNDLQTGSFEAGIDLADDVLGHGVGLDDRERAFDGHAYFSWNQWLKR